MASQTYSAGEAILQVTNYLIEQLPICVYCSEKSERYSHPWNWTCHWCDNIGRECSKVVKILLGCNLMDGKTCMVPGYSRNILPSELYISDISLNDIYALPYFVNEMYTAKLSSLIDSDR